MPGVQWRDPDLHEVIEFLSNPNSVIKVIMLYLMICHHQNIVPETSLPDPDRMIRMFLGLPDPHPDPLVTGTDPDPDRILPFSHKSVEQTEIIVVKIKLNTKIFLNRNTA